MPPSNEFLSGAADLTLGSMLGSLSINSNNNNGQKISKSTAKIQVIGDPTVSDIDYNDNDNDTDTDDELPPPIDTGGQGADSATTGVDGQSLMEQMMKEALKAREIEEKKMKTKERKNAKTSSFGFKKGFLSGTSKPLVKKKNQAKAKAAKAGEKVDRKQSDKNRIYELDPHGNMVPETKSRDGVETIPKPNPSLQAADSHPLHLKEVQEAMNDNTNSAWNNLSNTEWSSPDLLNRISENPKLIAGMANPKFTAALEALKNDPQEAMKIFRDHEDVMEFLNEFCSLLGDHFTKLGEKETQTQSQNLREEDLGPIAFRALQKESERKERGETLVNEGMDQQEQEQYDAIMKDEELTRIMMDVDIQRVIQECSTIPGKMQMYMRHEDYGIKLRKLIQAGLLRVA